MFNRILVLGFAICITACGGDELPESSSTVAAASTNVTATPLALYSDSDSLFTGGVANLSVSGGTAPYTFSVDNAATGSVSGGVFTSVRAGTVNITVRDATGATAQRGISVMDAPIASAPAPTTKPMYRFRHDGPGELWHLFTPEQAGDVAYAQNPEGIQYRVYASQVNGSVPLYACKMNNPYQIRFNTLDVNCEGQITAGRTIVGYAMPQGTASSGHQSVYRHKALLCPTKTSCYFALFESLSATPPSGYQYVGQIGNVPVQ